MIYTVTLNPAIDKTVVIDHFTPGQVNRAASVREDPGGKGINVSKCLKALGVDSTAAALFAGESGNRLHALLQAQDIPVIRVDVSGQSRTNLKIIDPAKQENTDINEPGPAVSRQSLDALREAVGARVQPGDMVVLSGSLPAGADPGLYRLWTAYFRRLGADVFLDADGKALELGIQSLPYMIKPNNHELARILGKEKLSAGEMLAEGRRLLSMGIKDVVISLGCDGALFVSGEGIYHARGLQVPVRSTVGAGDSMVAAMVYSREKDFSRIDTIRLAVAMGAASVMQDGSQPPEEELVWELAEKVEIEKLED